MLTKEFIREVEELGLECSDCLTIFAIYRDGDLVSLVSKNTKFLAGTAYDSFKYLPDELKEKLYNIIDDYARTPLEDREDEKKYYLKHRKTNISPYYLNVFCGEDGHIVESNVDMVVLKNQFTQKEIDEIKNIFNTRFDEFKQIPV